MGLLRTLLKVLPAPGELIDMQTLRESGRLALGALRRPSAPSDSDTITFAEALRRHRLDEAALPALYRRYVLTCYGSVGCSAVLLLVIVLSLAAGSAMAAGIACCPFCLALAHGARCSFYAWCIRYRRLGPLWLWLCTVRAWLPAWRLP